MARPAVTWEPTPAERAETVAIVSRLQAVRAERSRLEAEEARLLSRAQDIALRQLRRANAPSDWDMPIRSMSAEIAAALREGPRSIQGRMSDAATLVADFGSTLAALEAGRLSARHAAVIVAEGQRLGEVGDRLEYEARALAFAAGATVAALAPMCRSIADAFEASTLSERHERARATRRVRLAPLDDGMAELRLIAPVPLVQGIHDRLTSIARSVIAERDAFGRVDARAEGGVSRSRSGWSSGAAVDGAAAGNAAGDRRWIDEVRADVACDLLLAGAPSGHVVDDDGGQNLLAHVRGTIHVTIPAVVLTGTARGDGESDGGRASRGRRRVAASWGAAAGAPSSRRADAPTPCAIHATNLTPAAVATAGGEPIDPATARRLAREATSWERLFLDADTGALLTVDHYAPTTAQRRFLRARDEHCRFPGCRQGARRCDADHIVPHSEGGPTDVANLETLCKRHHMLKHHSPWRVRHLGAGELEWTSPIGHRYAAKPDSTVRFMETIPPDLVPT